MRAEREDPWPAVASNEVGWAGAESLVVLPEPTTTPQELPPPDFPGAPDPAFDRTQKRRRPNRWLLIALGILMAILAVDGAGVAANAALSSLYSPQRAIADYFAAQSSGSVSGMAPWK